MASRAQGYGASSLWKQRAHRWTVSALRITGKSLYSFFTYDTRGGVMSNIAFRLYRWVLLPDGLWYAGLFWTGTLHGLHFID